MANVAVELLSDSITGSGKVSPGTKEVKNVPVMTKD